MLDYPRFDIESTTYREQPLAGSKTILAEDGTPWIVRTHPVTRWRLTIVHKGMTPQQCELLKEFYEGAYGDYVRLLHELYGQHWAVLMEGPPEVVEMPSPVRVDVQMLVIGKPE